MYSSFFPSFLQNIALSYLSTEATTEYNCIKRSLLSNRPGIDNQLHKRHLKSGTGARRSSWEVDSVTERERSGDASILKWKEDLFLRLTLSSRSAPLAPGLLNSEPHYILTLYCLGPRLRNSAPHYFFALQCLAPRLSNSAPHYFLPSYSLDPRLWRHTIRTSTPHNLLTPLRFGTLAVLLQK